jgi:hypothetical protein
MPMVTTFSPSERFPSLGVEHMLGVLAPEARRIALIEARLVNEVHLALWRQTTTEIPMVFGPVGLHDGFRIPHGLRLAAGPFLPGRAYGEVRLRRGFGLVEVFKMAHVIIILPVVRGVLVRPVEECRIGGGERVGQGPVGVRLVEEPHRVGLARVWLVLERMVDGVDDDDDSVCVCV